MALRCCMLIFFHDFCLMWGAGESEEGREGERRQHSSLCSAREGYLQVSVL